MTMQDRCFNCGRVIDAEYKITEITKKGEKYFCSKKCFNQVGGRTTSILTFPENVTEDEMKEAVELYQVFFMAAELADDPNFWEKWNDRSLEEKYKYVSSQEYVK